MTLWGRLLSFFPSLHVLLVAASFFWCVGRFSWAAVTALLFFLYGFPLCVFRLHQLFFPLKEGVFHLEEKKYSPWWGSHQIQLLYIALPWLEGILRLVPGLFSLWLRSWGSRVGKSVHWTPLVEVADRSLLEVGDGVIFGHKVECFSHVVKPRNGRLLLYVRKIAVGHGAFLGAGSRLGPGVRIEPGAAVPVLSDLYPNRVIGQKSTEVSHGA